MFIDSDEFEGIELFNRRPSLAELYLFGTGIEIGALHKPLPTSEHCTVRYIDYKSLEENRIRYPELAEVMIVTTDVVDDGFSLTRINDDSQDFIIANHVLEHSPDALGTLEKWHQKLKAGGIIYAAIPIAEKCYDKGRPITTIEHFIADNNYFMSLTKPLLLKTTRNHIEEFITISNRNIREANGMEYAASSDNEKLLSDLMIGLELELNAAATYEEALTAHIVKVNRIYDIHYHTFTPKSYEALLNFFCSKVNAKLENVIKNGSGECIGIIKKY